MILHRVIFIACAFLCMAYKCSAQIGPSITTPAQNDTITPGEKLDIQYSYMNMGAGDYSVDIALWLDPGCTSLLQNITTGHEITSGNSTGDQLQYTQNATYEWNVPHGLNETVYLTVIENANTQLLQSTRLRSRPVMLHVNEGLLNKPAHWAPLMVIMLCSFVVLI